MIGLCLLVPDIVNTDFIPDYSVEEVTPKTLMGLVTGNRSLLPKSKRKDGRVMFSTPDDIILMLIDSHGLFKVGPYAGRIAFEGEKESKAMAVLKTAFGFSNDITPKDLERIFQAMTFKKMLFYLDVCYARDFFDPKSFSGVSFVPIVVLTIAALKRDIYALVRSVLLQDGCHVLNAFVFVAVFLVLVGWGG